MTAPADSFKDVLGSGRGDQRPDEGPPPYDPDTWPGSAKPIRCTDGRRNLNLNLAELAVELGDRATALGLAGKLSRTRRSYRWDDRRVFELMEPHALQYQLDAMLSEDA